jgi:hypothetical protein
MIVMALRRGAKSKIGEARFGKCRLTITPPEFIKGVRERRIFRKKKWRERPPISSRSLLLDPTLVFSVSIVWYFSGIYHTDTKGGNLGCVGTVGMHISV